MRNLLMIASAAALAMSMPALAKEKGGGDKGGGPKAEKGHKPDKGHGGGQGGGWKADKGGKHEREGGWARQEIKAERSFEKREQKAQKNWAKSDKNWAKAEQKREKQWRKAEAKTDKQFVKQERSFRKEDRGFREAARRDDRRDRYDDRHYDGDRRFAGSFDDGCPPGLAKKNNGCLPPGQAKKLFSVGEAIPAAYYPSYNLPGEYRDWYPESSDYSYRYDDGYIYRVDNGSNLVSALIPLLGGGFSVGNLLPAGFDAYNLPTQYRDDYVDSPDAFYRYGDDAIYQVDPQTNLIQSVVALLAGDLNVGQLLPSGYDTYNLPMDYRDQYQDSDEAMYRYADGNIYEVDPKSRMIEAIVAQLI
jgi:hypothetical protein